MTRKTFLDLPKIPDLKEGQALPKFSVVIPTFNCALTITWTLDALNAQDYPDLEIIIVDAGSTDRTLDVAQRQSDRPLRIYSIAEESIFEMYNRGISLATGEYVSMLFPGDSYLSNDTLMFMGALIATHDWPDLAYCGCLRRDPVRDPEVLMGALELERLKKGDQPSSIQSCWYRVETIRRLGKFDTDYRIRAPLDLIIRFYLHGGLKVARLQRVLVDHDRPYQLPGALLRRGLETHAIISHHFGWKDAILWWLKQNHWRFLSWWWQTKKHHLFS